MISPYRREIEFRTRKIIFSIKENLSKKTSNPVREDFDCLSFLYLREVVFYSRDICDLQGTLERSKDLPDIRYFNQARSKGKKCLNKILQELTSVNQEWKNLLKLKGLYLGD
jgi:hypothetical protein